MNQPIEDTAAGTVKFPADWSWLLIHAWLASRGLEIEWWEGSPSGELNSSNIIAHVQLEYPPSKGGVTIIGE